MSGTNDAFGRATVFAEKSAMKERNKMKYLYSKESGILQIPYAEYVSLMEKVEEGQRLREVKNTVLTDLERFIVVNPERSIPMDAVKSTSEKAVEAVAVAQEPKDIGSETVVEAEEREESPVPQAAPSAEVAPRTVASDMEIPPIKKDIAAYFNTLDESGRLFNVLKQYYTCLNDSCGGTVRVTMKDGVCSLWNYDEWEEFAFLDVFDGHVRVSLDPRYTEKLQALNFCEVPRLLSCRRNLVSVQVDDLNNTMLDVLSTAFGEVGISTL